MDALEVLATEHSRLLDRFDVLADTMPRERRPILDELIRTLDAHLTIDEQLVLPATGARGRLAVLARTAAQEAESVLHELFALDCSRGDFVHRLLRLRDTLAGAIAIEEDMLYPALDEAVPGERLDALGHKIEVWLKSLNAGPAVAA
jgi:hypothetical protein